MSLVSGHKFWWMASVLFTVTFAVQLAIAAEPPSDLCSLLPAADVNKVLGATYGAPQKSVAPRPYANTVEGTDCNYHSGNSKLWFRAYADPSPAEAKDLFARLRTFYSPATPVSGIGDEAYFDRQHAIHVRKGRVRYYLNLSPTGAATEKQLKELATEVANKL